MVSSYAHLGGLVSLRQAQGFGSPAPLRSAWRVAANQINFSAGAGEQAWTREEAWTIGALLKYDGRVNIGLDAAARNCRRKCYG